MKRIFIFILAALLGFVVLSDLAYSLTYTFTQNSPFVFGASTSSSSIFSGGTVGAITDVNVTLNGVRVNSFFQGISEFDILLVGPQGQKIILMAYVCKTFTTPGPVDFTFDASASSTLPNGTDNGSPCVSGTYLPSDYRDLTPEGYIITSPAPDPPYSLDLAQFNANSGNGAWTLYAAEDGGNEGGTIANWAVTIETDGVPLPCDYEDLFEDGVLTYTQLNASVLEAGGNLRLQPAGKKAYAVSDSSFAGMQNGKVTAEITFTTNNQLKEKGWMVTHWQNKKNLMEIQFNIERGKVIVKQKAGTVLAKQKGDFAFAFNTPYTVEASYTAGVYEVRIDGALIVSLATVNALPTGIVGFEAKGLSESINSVCVAP